MDSGGSPMASGWSCSQNRPTPTEQLCRGSGRTALAHLLAGEVFPRVSGARAYTRQRDEGNPPGLPFCIHHAGSGVDRIWQPTEGGLPRLYSSPRRRRMSESTAGGYGERALRSGRCGRMPSRTCSYRMSSEKNWRPAEPVLVRASDEGQLAGRYPPSTWTMVRKPPSDIFAIAKT